MVAPSNGMASMLIPPRALARNCLVLALCLFLGYLLAALPLLPPRLLDPLWQQRASTSLIAAAPLPLAGLLLIQFAGLLDPANRPLQRLWRPLGNLALLAATGFLLLIPLQLYGAWSSGSQQRTPGPQERLLNTTSLLRQAIREASSHQDLQKRLQKLPSPGLQPADLATPLPQLRTELLAGVDQVEARIRSRYRRQAPPKAALAMSLLPSLLGSLLLALLFSLMGHPFRSFSRYAEQTYFESLTPQEPPEPKGAEDSLPDRPG